MTFTFHPGSEHTMLKLTAPRSTQSKHAFRDLEEAARLISRDMRVTGSEMAKWGRARSAQKTLQDHRPDRLCRKPGLRHMPAVRVQESEAEGL